MSLARSVLLTDIPEELSPLYLGFRTLSSLCQVIYSKVLAFFLNMGSNFAPWSSPEKKNHFFWLHRLQL